MFVVGLELDVSLVKGRGKVAGSVSVCSIVLPFSLGIGLAKIFVEIDATAGLKPDGADFWPFALFMGAAMSITAFPVLARILTDRRMHRTETGGLALACAATDDIIAWTLLAVVLAIAGVDGGHGHLPSWGIYLAIPFVLVAIFVVRPALSVAHDGVQEGGELTPTILSVVLVGMLLFSASTEVIGIHYIFGAFLFGAIIPHENAAAMRHEILVRLEQISVLLLLPGLLPARPASRSTSRASAASTSSRWSRSSRSRSSASTSAPTSAPSCRRCRTGRPARSAC